LFLFLIKHISTYQAAINVSMQQQDRTYQPALDRKDKNYVSTTGLTNALSHL